jgi:hypothetical protein
MRRNFGGAMRNAPHDWAGQAQQGRTCRHTGQELGLVQQPSHAIAIRIYKTRPLVIENREIRQTCEGEFLVNNKLPRHTGVKNPPHPAIGKCASPKRKFIRREISAGVAKIGTRKAVCRPGCCICNVQNFVTENFGSHGRVGEIVPLGRIHFTGGPNCML